MIDGNRVLAVIPARGGSKGVPRKNVRDLAGKPLIAWTIDAAKHSKYIDRIIVSSEDEEIISVAKANGCEAPFVRPPELATDTASGVDVLLHAIDGVGALYDYVVLLQPTSPLRNHGDIDGALRLCFDRNLASVVAVSEATKSPYWMFKLGEDETLIPFAETENLATNRQQLPKAYAVNGAVYVLKVSSFLERRKILSEDTVGYVMPAERSYDIDTEMDFRICDFLKRNFEHDE